MSLLNGVPNVSTCPTCPTCLTCPTCPRDVRALLALRALSAHAIYVPKFILQTRKLKISVLIKSNEGLFTDVFKGLNFDLDFN